MSINRHEIIGNLGSDPEVKSLEHGMVANIAVATNEKWKIRSTGEIKDHTEWHYAVLRNRLAEIARDYLKKGSKVYLSGPVRTRQWEDKKGNTQYKKEILVKEIQMLDQLEKAVVSDESGE